MIVTGTLFKIVGFSFVSARTISLVSMVISFILLTLLTRHYGLDTPSVLVCGLFFLNRYFIAAGNVARMEAMLLCVICLGFMMLQRKMIYKGLALLLLSPLIHPNGLYFIAGACMYYFTNGRGQLRGRDFTKSDLAIISLAIALLLGYLLYVILQWQWFWSDMATQFARKLKSSAPRRMFNRYNLSILFLILLCYFYCVKKDIRAVFLLFLGVPALLVKLVGAEMWYDVFDGIGHLILFILIVHVAYNLAAALTALFRRITMAALVIQLIWWGYAIHWIENPFNYAAHPKWHEMQMPRHDDVPYITNSDIKTIQATLKSRCSPHHHTHIGFIPRADGLFFQGMSREGIQIINPLFYDYDQVGNVYIVHMSRYSPKRSAHGLRRLFLRSGINPDEHVILKRDGTEVWYFYIIKEGDLEKIKTASDPKRRL
ncbi:MAG: hypothetical protein NTX71_03090 [Candidatus Aureabacteria bacterium]|nr:hypothetical protein [Candidatus Auribacterota bacterium]